MNELLAIGIIIAVMAVFYFFIYPRAKRVSQLRWLDLVASLIAIGSVGVFGASQAAFAYLFGWELNWFVFGLIAYVVLETPAWAVYMNRHPHQGTWAQLYGFSSSAKQKEKVAKNIETVMNDTDWDWLRTKLSQRILVIVGVLTLVAAPLVFWFEDYIKPGIGILAVIPIFLVWWLLRLSVRLVADAPDQYLDEFQVSQRDRTYLHSFRILAGLVTGLAIALMIITISSDYQTKENIDYYHFALTFGQVNAVIWSILGSTILIPNLVLAWNQSMRRSN